MILNHHKNLKRQAKRKATIEAKAKRMNGRTQHMSEKINERKSARAAEARAESRAKATMAKRYQLRSRHIQGEADVEMEDEGCGTEDQEEITMIPEEHEDSNNDIEIGDGWCIGEEDDFEYEPSNSRDEDSDMDMDIDGDDGIP